MSMCNKALEWASRGRPVFPCGPDKRPLTSHGFKDASTEPSEIRQMWSMHPDAMIGMPTGKASGIVVLDFDLDEDKGFNAVPVFTELRAAGMVPEGTYTVRTPRGGLHVHLEASLAALLGELAGHAKALQGLDGQLLERLSGGEGSLLDDEKLVSTGFDILEDWSGAVSFDPAEVNKERIAELLLPDGEALEGLIAKRD